MHRHVTDMGFQQEGLVDPCLFFWKEVVIVVYVDDCLIFSPKKEHVDELAKELQLADAACWF